MKTRLRLLFVPVLLGFAVWWAIGARWQRVEADFRAALLREYLTPNAKGIEVFIGGSKGEKSLGFLTRAQVQSLAPRLFLQKGAISPAPLVGALSTGAPRLRFEGEEVDFTVALGETLDGDSVSFGFSWREQRLQLKPVSRRAVRELAERRWEREIAAFRVGR